MLGVAERWLADDLARLEGNARPRLLADLYRCARETGWTLGPVPDAPFYGEMETYTYRAPRGEAGVEMRVHPFVPLLGFVAAVQPEEGEGGRWGRPYLDPPGLTGWWQAVGWLVPDVGWLNDTPSARELEGLPSDQARELRRWRSLSRGDALLFEW